MYLHFNSQIVYLFNDRKANEIGNEEDDALQPREQRTRIMSGT